MTYALLTQGIGCCSKVFSNKASAGVCSRSLYKGYSFRSLGNLWDIRAPSELTAWLRTGPRLRENKHYFSGVYLTFDFEGWDLVTLLCQTLCRHMVVNYLKVEGMHNVADRKYKVAFSSSGVYDSVWARDKNRGRARACECYIACCSHFTPQRCPIETPPMDRMPIKYISFVFASFCWVNPKYLLDVSNKKSVHWKASHHIWHWGQRRSKLAFQHHLCGQKNEHGWCASFCSRAGTRARPPGDKVK